mmetsp:Transcript_15006/g.47860  ORF Transcript_15006/g.47860 Transcript_15006/m.47860 type:complete len:213 (+) Transcript_15006:367-1005(+)
MRQPGAEYQRTGRSRRAAGQAQRRAAAPPPLSERTTLHRWRCSTASSSTSTSTSAPSSARSIACATASTTRWPPCRRWRRCLRCRSLPPTQCPRSWTGSATRWPRPTPAPRRPSQPAPTYRCPCAWRSWPPSPTRRRPRFPLFPRPAPAPSRSQPRSTAATARAWARTTTQVAPRARCRSRCRGSRCTAVVVARRAARETWVGWWPRCWRRG